MAEKADYIIGETFDAYGEAKLALDAILKHGNGKKPIVNFFCHSHVWIQRATVGPDPPWKVQIYKVP